MVSKELLQILACPSCKGEISYYVRDIAYDKEFFICETCKLKFKVIEGIPDFLLETAVKISEEEIEEVSKFKVFPEEKKEEAVKEQPKEEKEEVPQEAKEETVEGKTEEIKEETKKEEKQEEKEEKKEEKTPKKTAKSKSLKKAILNGETKETSKKKETKKSEEKKKTTRRKKTKEE
jgi:uncharacterized protein YbaR (Trm112 family)